jgi:hypothetical protein
MSRWRQPGVSRVAHAAVNEIGKLFLTGIAALLQLCRPLKAVRSPRPATRGSPSPDQREARQDQTRRRSPLRRLQKHRERQAGRPSLIRSLQPHRQARRRVPRACAVDSRWRLATAEATCARGARPSQPTSRPRTRRHSRPRAGPVMPRATTSHRLTSQRSLPSDHQFDFFAGCRFSCPVLSRHFKRFLVF